MTRANRRGTPTREPVRGRRAMGHTHQLGQFRRNWNNMVKSGFPLPLPPVKLKPKQNCSKHFRLICFGNLLVPQQWRLSPAMGTAFYKVGEGWWGLNSWPSSRSGSEEAKKNARESISDSCQLWLRGSPSCFCVCFFLGVESPRTHPGGRVQRISGGSMLQSTKAALFCPRRWDAETWGIPKSLPNQSITISSKKQFLKQGA